MKNVLLTSFLFFVSFRILAENWHPFPFKAAFYTRKVEIGAYEFVYNRINPNGPLQKGLVVEGLYLDSSVQQSNGVNLRTRSAKYPTGVNWPGFALAPVIYETKIQTSADSSRVKYFYKKPYNTDFDSIVFLPALKQIETTSQTQRQFSVESFFGIQDSVLSITVDGLNYSWSKTFGVIQFNFYSGGSPPTELRLIGVHDLNIGWKPFSGKPVPPKVGDEYHYRDVKRYDRFYGGPGCDSVHTDDRHDFRVKVVDYPYQGDSSQAKYECIESLADATTGVLYECDHNILQLLPFQNFDFSGEYKMPGTFNLPDMPFQDVGSNGFFIDSLGITMAYQVSPMVVDGFPIVGFIPCSAYPIGGLLGYGSFGGGLSCNFLGMEMRYPFYVKSQNGCTMGTPLPPVTITSVSGSRTKPVIKLSPNPAQNVVHIQLGDHAGSSVVYQLSTANGQTFTGDLSIQNQEATLDLSEHPAGLYILRLFVAGAVFTEKIVLDK